MRFNQLLILFGAFVLFSCSTNRQFSSRELKHFKDLITAKNGQSFKGFSLRDAQNDVLLYSI